MDPLSRFVVALVLLLVAALSLAVTAGQMHVALQRQVGWWQVFVPSSVCIASIRLSSWAAGGRNPFGRPIPGSTWPLRRVRGAQALLGTAALVLIYLFTGILPASDDPAAQGFGAAFIFLISALAVIAAATLSRTEELGRRLAVWLGAFAAGWLFLMSLRLTDTPEMRMGPALFIAYLLVASPWVAMAAAGLATWSARARWPGRSGSSAAESARSLDSHPTAELNTTTGSLENA